MTFYETIKLQITLCFKRKMVYFVFAAFILLNLYCAYIRIINPSSIRDILVYNTSTIQPAYMNFSLEKQTLLPFLILPFAFALCALPFADSYFTDNKSGITPILFSKMKLSYYYLSKLIIVFLSSFIVFFLPLMINQLVLLSFYPVDSNITFNYCGTLDSTFYRNFLYSPLPKLAFYHPYIYNILYSALFSFFVGLMSCLTYVCSFIVKRIKIIPLVIPFILYELSLVIDPAVNAARPKDQKIPIAFVKFLEVHDTQLTKYPYVFISIIFISIIVIAILMKYQINKEQI